MVFQLFSLLLIVLCAALEFIPPPFLTLKMSVVESELLFFFEVVLNHGDLPLLGASLGMRSSPNLANPSGMNSDFSPLVVPKLFSFIYYQVDVLGFHPALLLFSYLPESSRPHLHLFCLPLASCRVLDVPLVLRSSLLLSMYF